MRLLIAAATAITLIATPTTPATASPRSLDPTPYMGWNTYFGLGGDPTEAEVKSVTDVMVSSGLRDAGYRIVWIDGNWAAPTPRDTAGRLVADRATRASMRPSRPIRPASRPEWRSGPATSTRTR